jgi:hypothetical protein
MKCPVCRNRRTKFWKKIQSNKIDQSGLYGDIIIYHCESCDHYFNYVSGKKYRKHIDDYTKSLEEERLKEITGNIDIVSANHLVEHYLDYPVKNRKSWDVVDIYCPLVTRYKALIDTDSIYCWLIKEHVQHFSKQSLSELFDNYYIQHYSEYNFLELNNKLKIPSMHVVFTAFDPDGYYYYGAGREFLYSYADRFNWEKKEIFDKPRALVKIIDDKQFGNSINGIPIYHSEIVPYLSDKAEINITSWYHAEKMEAQLIEKGFRGKIY